jgi:Thermolysin metallopeptidase, alpha-helical domain
MNESFSDIWGEIFDQSNSGLTPSGTDTTANRWLLGEDLPGGAIRNMSNPPAFNNPDRTGSALYRAPVTYPRGGTGMDNNDQGGVHSNSGVGNKLCVLLAAGGSFNGKTISNLGNNTTLDLFYDVNTNYLTPGSDWLDLNFAMRQAAATYGTAVATNVGNACDAVEIHIAGRVRHLDRGTFAINRIGIPEVVGSYGPYRTFAEALAGVGNGGTLKVQGGGGMVPVDPGFTLSQPMTIRTYDPYQPPAGTANPPTPFDIRVP